MLVIWYIVERLLQPADLKRCRQNCGFQFYQR
jgi:hypothetical protein